MIRIKKIHLKTAVNYFYFINIAEGYKGGLATLIADIPTVDCSSTAKKYFSTKHTSKTGV